MYDWTPLHYAVCNGNLMMVEFLAKNGGNTKAIDGMRRTPLKLSQAKGYSDISDFLINYTS